MDAQRIVATILGVLVWGLASAQDGDADQSFGNLGRTWIDVTPNLADYGHVLVQLPNGGFFMGGACLGSVSSGPCAAWLTPTGNLATGFGPNHNGTASFGAYTGWPSDGAFVTGAAALPNGRVVVIVRKQSLGSVSSYLALLRADGTGLDPSVANGAGYIDPPFQLAMFRVTPQQQVVAVGYGAGTPQPILIARFNSDFRLDTTFGTNGSTTFAFSADATPSGMTLQRDGKIVVTGNVGAFGSGSSKLGVARLTANGQPDTDFGLNFDGRFENNFGYSLAIGNDIVEDKKGRLVFAGSVRSSTDSPFPGFWLVGRLLSGGAIDADFNAGIAQVFTIFGTSTNNTPSAQCVALQSDNRIVVLGTMDRSTTAADYYYGLARFTDNGEFDSTFGSNGQSYNNMSPEGAAVVTDNPSALVIVPGGIVIGGNTMTSSEARFSATKVKIDLLFASDFE